MARQSGTSTPIFDQLVREMAEGKPADQPTSAGRTGTSSAVPVRSAPVPRRRHRAE